MLIKATDNLILNADIIHKAYHDDGRTVIHYADTDEEIKSVSVDDPICELWNHLEVVAGAGIDFDSDMDL